MRVFGNFDRFNNFSLLIRGIVFILSNYYFTIDRKRTSIIKLKPITKKRWKYIPFLYIPTLLIIGYNHTSNEILLDFALAILTFGMSIIIILTSDDEDE